MRSGETEFHRDDPLRAHDVEQRPLRESRGAKEPFELFIPEIRDILDVRSAHDHGMAADRPFVAQPRNRGFVPEKLECAIRILLAERAFAFHAVSIAADEDSSTGETKALGCGSHDAGDAVTDGQEGSCYVVAADWDASAGHSPGGRHFRSKIR